MQSIRNILITNEFFHPIEGGIEQYLLFFSKFLISQGIEVNVLTSRFRDDLPPTTEFAGITIYYSDLLNGSLNNPLKTISSSPQIASIISQINPDIVYANNHSSLAIIKAAKMVQKPVVYVCHGVGLMCPLKRRFLQPGYRLCWEGMSWVRCSKCYLFPIKWYKPLNYFLNIIWKIRDYAYAKKILSSANARIGNSNMTAKLFKKSKDTYGIPIMTDTSENGYCPVISDDTLEKFGLTHKQFLFITGRLQSYKGHRYAIEALALMPPTIVLVIGGSSSLANNDPKGSYEVELTHYIKEHKLDNRVIFTGRLTHSELRALYSSARITIVPSIWIETFGSVTLESMACETTVIVTENSGSSECVTSQTGRIIPRQSSKAIADAVLEIWDNAIKMGKQARHDVVEKYSIDVLGKKTLSTLEQIVKKSKLES